MEKEIILNKSLPKHIAIILDGNGRWAKIRQLPRTQGHLAGFKNLMKIAYLCDKYKIEVLTVFAFSTENWKRPKMEINFLMNLPHKMLKLYHKRLQNSNIKIQFLGRKDRFPLDTLNDIKQIEEMTKEHQGLLLNICFDYGSRYELFEAFRNIHDDISSGIISIEDLNEDLIENYLYTKNNPPLDLLIRTSGEKRISNFLLYQMAYSEIYFTDTLWPDFDEEELLKALDSFQNRKRRYGALDKGE